VTMREREDGTYKVSVRTYPPYDAAAVCNQLGGGGHKGAAGYEFDSSLEEGKAQILKVLEGAL
ncbi:MAG: bifunctional oligoribonuclease/PAP phosphatase NrnA, partial [Clostridiales bacterium]|nr:bifunctional oligoribonuclease/PAP phosphatase NrnA [Clostridiales bacterium]